MRGLVTSQDANPSFERSIHQVSARTFAAASPSGDNNAAPPGDNNADLISSGGFPSGVTTTAPPAEGGLSAGVMIGAGAAVGVLLLLVGAWVWWRFRQAKRVGDTDRLKLAEPIDFNLPKPEDWLIKSSEPEPMPGKSFLPGAAATLGGCVLTGTFLSMGGSTLEGLLAAGEAVPFVGEVCSVLLSLKRHVDDFHDAEEECRRLSVWCLAMMGSFSKLATETTVVDDAMKELLQAAGVVVRELYELVMKRHSSDGVAARVCAFWTTGEYLDQAKMVKEKVQKALEALMLRSTPNPQLAILNPQLSILHPPISALNPQPSILHPLPSTVIPQPSTLIPQPSSRNPLPSTLNPQPSTLNPQPSPLTPHSSPRNPQPSTLNPHPSPLIHPSPLNPQPSTLNP